MGTVQSVKMDIYYSNTCKKDLSWLHLDEPRVQNYSIQDHMVDLKRSRATSGERNFIEHQGSNVLGGSFSNWDNVRTQIEFRRERQLFDIKT